MLVQMTELYMPSSSHTRTVMPAVNFISIANPLPLSYSNMFGVNRMSTV